MQHTVLYRIRFLFSFLFVRLYILSLTALFRIIYAICLGDNARDLVLAEVPKTHPLFNLKGDDPLDILERLK